MATITAIRIDGVMSAEIAIAWSSMTGKVFGMRIPCVIVRSFLEDRLRVVVLLCSDVRGVSVTLKKNFGIYNQWGGSVHGLKVQAIAPSTYLSTSPSTSKLIYIYGYGH